MATRPFFLVLIAAASLAQAEAPLADSSESSAQAPWQSDYGKFVEAYRACVADASCDVHAMLAGKPVVWEGTVVKTRIGFNRIDLQMWPDEPSVTDRKGVTHTLRCCSPNLGTQDGWIDLRPGKIVRFSARLEAGGEAFPAITLFGGPGEPPKNPPSYLTPISGPVAVVQLTQAELLSSR